VIGEHDATRPPSEDDTPTEIFRPIRVRERRKARWAAGLALVVVAVLAVSSYKVFAGLGHHPAPKLASAPARVSASTASAASTSASASASVSPPVAASSAPAATVLRAASVAAFGPSGVTDGDNPQLAARVLGGRGPWQSDWYVTPQFGDLKHGTGLLIDMGTTVTITQVQALLGTSGGGTLVLLAGNSPALASLGEVAPAGPAGGGLERFTLAHPVHARYLLLWFTRLAPDGAGHYQAVVNGIKVLGTA
jgi:hypothetical protein